MQIAADRGDPLSHQRQAVAGGVRAAGAVVMYFDCQEFGSRSVPAGPRPLSAHLAGWPRLRWLR